MGRHVLISLIGEETIPNYRVYKEFQPELLIQIFSTKTKGQNDILKQLVKKGDCICQSVNVDADDFKSLVGAFGSIDSILPDDDVTINITGGNKLMAIGAVNFFQSIPNTAKRMLYVDFQQRIHWMFGGTDESLDTFTENLSFNEFISLSGQKVKSYMTLPEVQSRFSESLNEIQELYTSNRKLWDKFFNNILVRTLKEMKKGNLADSKGTGYLNNVHTSLENVIARQDQFEVEWTDSIFELYHEDVLLLELNENRQAVYDLLFNSQWFEIMCALSLEKQFPNCELLLNVVFEVLSDPQKKLDKNEVDIILNQGDRLLFVECKSGSILPDEINKMYARKNLYGGKIAENLLMINYDITSLNNNAMILERCKEFNIGIRRLNIS